MIAKEVEIHIEALESLFQTYKMRKVWLFGSATDSNLFQKDSDIDFIYDPDKEQMTLREFLDNPERLKKELEKIFNRKVDFIRHLPFKNPYFQKEVEETKQLIFENSPSNFC